MQPGNWVNFWLFPGTSILERIYEGVNVYYNYTGEAKCFELDDDPHGMSGWDWQVYKS